MKNDARAHAPQWKSMVLPAVRCIFYASALLLSAGADAASPADRLTEQVSGPADEHSKITSIVFLSKKYERSMNEDANAQILTSLERKFESEHVPVAAYPLSSVKIDPVDGNPSEPGHISYLTPPDYAKPALETGKSPEPSHLLHLTVLNMTWASKHGTYQSDANITGFSYRIEVVEASTGKLVYVYGAKVEREEPGEAAIRVGKRFFERLQKDGML